MRRTFLLSTTGFVKSRPETGFHELRNATPATVAVNVGSGTDKACEFPVYVWDYIRQEE